MRPAILCFIGVTLLLLSGFKQTAPAPDDKLFLDIVATHDRIPVFNYTTKMAAVDTRPFDPKHERVFPPTTLFKSRSTDTLTHGGRVFRLRAKFDSNYAYDIAQPEGQVLHMATFDYTTATTTLGDGKSLRMGDSLYLNPTTRRHFYLMLKTNSQTYPTDSGWVYAVVSPDGKKVLQKGLIASCMACHSQSKTDRMLGAR
ncbi:MAG TPA: hypothetical protein VK154_04040 [Chitinophagales bacterium]|nr:hypothetical protein [Chitinophagales bacterium]